jgi:hypothetical protein
VIIFVFVCQEVAKVLGIKDLTYCSINIGSKKDGLFGIYNTHDQALRKDGEN